MPVTRPRRATNQRLAMVAAKTMAIEPVPSPISTPQVSTSCQPDVTKIVSPLPAATSSRAKLVTWRMPKRSISAAANGAISPYRIRLTLTALDISVRDQPNSCSIGTISTPGAARKPAAPTSATNATTATGQAGWIPVRARAAWWFPACARACQSNRNRRPVDSASRSRIPARREGLRQPSRLRLGPTS